MNVNLIVSIAGLCIVGYIAYKAFRINNRDEKIDELENKKSKIQGELDRIEVERNELKELVEDKHENLSEDGKVKFWEEYLGKVKKDD